MATAGAAAAAVMNDHVKEPAIGSPAVSLAPLIVAVYVVPYAKVALGVKVVVLVVEL